MSFCLIPDMSIESINDLKPDMLSGRGISLLILDLDNTLIPYSEPLPPDRVKEWMEGFKEQGIDLFLVSNNRTDRAEIFSKAASIPYVSRARKPSAKKVFEAMNIMERKPNETAMLGDQIYTDVLAANSAGVFSIVVKPIDRHKPHFAARYFVELPFRALAKVKV